MTTVTHPCSAPECDRDAVARTWCLKHYKRWRNRGTVHDITTEERFFSHVEQPGDCWLWMAFREPHGGYGKFFLDDRCLYAHRWAYEFLRGEIPPGLHLDHLCRTPACVNPWHLEPVTARVNVVERGRGTTARNAAKTHCLRNHALDTSNTYTDKRGRRQCRRCATIRNQRRRTAS
jgi:hypothetical protein